VRRWRFFLGEAMQSVRANFATTLAATLTVLIVTLLLGVFSVAGYWLYHYLTGVQNQVTVKAYLPKSDARDSAALNRIDNQIRRIRYVKPGGVQYVSPQEALNKLSSKERQDALLLPTNPLPPSFWIHLTDPKKAAYVQEQLYRIPDIQNCGSKPCVDYGKAIVSRVLTIATWTVIIVGVLVALIGIASVVLIANTIRLSIFARRREIEVMKLVGATNWFVRIPFVLEGMLTGFVGAVLAVCLLLAAYLAVVNLNQDLHPTAGFPGGVPALMLLLTAFGLVLGAFGSSLTLRKFLKV
jgi:cell division transport system permease protein